MAEEEGARCLATYKIQLQFHDGCSAALLQFPPSDWPFSEAQPDSSSLEPHHPKGEQNNRYPP